MISSNLEKDEKIEGMYISNKISTKRSEVLSLPIFKRSHFDNGSRE